MNIVNDNDLLDYLTLSQASIYLGVAQSTLRRWALGGVLDSSKTLGGHFRFIVEDLDNFIQEQGMSGT